MGLKSSLESRRPGGTLGKMLLYEFVGALCAMLFVLIYRVRVRGASNIPAKGPLLIAANHQSFLDPPLVGCFVRNRHLSFVAKIGLFTFGPFAWFISALNSVPINDTAGDAGAIKEILKRLAAGHAVLIFPEGSRTHDGGQKAFKRGVALLMKRAKCPVVPAAVEGCFDAWGPGVKFPRLLGHRVAVTYGKPIPYDELEKDGAQGALDRIAREVNALRLQTRADMRRASGNSYPPAGPGDHDAEGISPKA
ncbi:MAG: 1-acyl-sn-glycerol-3-phosphate acyltransferase [Phycisphaeraceae bacterium]|nr:1-acyl-sn-glycerol-3-phosphate acyltransferase [Phycisphaeraceae bacterium]